MHEITYAEEAPAPPRLDRAAKYDEVRARLRTPTVDGRYLWACLLRYPAEDPRSRLRLRQIASNVRGGHGRWGDDPGVWETRLADEGDDVALWVHYIPPTGATEEE